MNESVSTAPSQTRLPSGLIGSIGAVVLAFAVGAILIFAVGVDPVKAYGALFEAALGSRNGIAETLLRTIPLALCGLGIALAFRGGVFNVGAEGQLMIGGTAAGAIGVAGGGWPGFVLMPAMAIGAMLAGGLWSALAGWLKLRFRADELITTIMLNYVAVHLVSYFLHGPLQDPNSALAQTARLGSEGRLPVLLPGTRLHAGILIVLAVVILAHLFLWKRTAGFRLRVVGFNPRAALNAGMNVRGTILFGFVICGVLAGLAGFAEVSGVQRRMIENLSPGYGYTAIIVALLGQTNPFGVLASAFLFAALQIGATTMESAAGVPSTLATIIQGLVVLFLIGRTALPMLRERLSRKRPT